MKTCFLDSESRVLTITRGNFTIPEEEHGRSIKDVVRETPLQMLGKSEITHGIPGPMNRTK